MNGMILRNETVINSNYTGSISYNFTSGERVAVNTDVASVYVGNVNMDLQYQLADVTAQLDELSKNSDQTTYYLANPQQAMQQMAASAKTIIGYATNNNLSQITAEKRTMENIVDNSTVAQKNQKIASLQQQQASLQSQVSSFKKDIITPDAGVFIPYLDGQEGKITVDQRDALLPSQLDLTNAKVNTMQTSVTAGQPAFKIVDNYTWYYLGILDNKTATQMSVGNTVYLTFPDMASPQIAATVNNINDEENGQNVVVFSCNEDISDSYLLRSTSSILQLNTYSGLKIPTSAIHVDSSGNTGVYIVQNGAATFKKVTVLYSNSLFTIVGETNSELKLYDQVVISGKNLKEGKTVQKQ